MLHPEIIKDLFAIDSSNEFYTCLQNNSRMNVQLSREYWNTVYKKYNSFLDKDFYKEFPSKCINRLWELALIDFLGSLNNKNVKLLENKPGKSSKPDFCFKHNNQKFYLEAICPEPGSSEKYPFLNAPLEIGKVRDFASCYQEYEERLLGAFKAKARCKYDPSQCDPSQCNHSFKGGYKSQIGNDGFIIAISMADIPWHNQHLRPEVDIGCFFSFSPFKNLVTRELKSGEREIKESYYSYQMCFSKEANNSEIKKDCFSTKEYEHVSGVLISQKNFLLSENDIKQGIYNNDFMLIHNPFAKPEIRLAPGLFPVSMEITALLDGEEIVAVNY